MTSAKPGAANQARVGGAATALPSKVLPKELKPGDVLLFNGSGFISDMIRLFDGSQYSHAALFDGHNVVEAIASGITARPLAASVADAKYVDVYRFVSEDGHKLTDPGYAVQPLLDTAAHFVADGERYAYEQIVLLAALAGTRRIPIVSDLPFLRWILRNVLDNATEAIAKLIAAGKEPMICSELVYRCYTESGPQYDLLIRGADTLAARLQTLPPVGASVLEDGGQPPEAESIRAELDTFIAKYERAKFKAGIGANHKSKSAAEKKPKGELTSPSTIAASTLAVADFVTPRDLRDSPDLFLIGTLQGGVLTTS